MIIIPLRPYFEPPRHEHAVYVEGCARCVTKQIMAQREMLNRRSFEEELIQAMLEPLYCGCRCKNPYGECGCCDDGGW